MRMFPKALKLDGTRARIKKMEDGRKLNKEAEKEKKCVEGRGCRTKRKRRWTKVMQRNVVEGQQVMKSTGGGGGGGGGRGRSWW